MERWLKLQLGVEKPRMFPEELINDSHKANRKVAPDSNGASYAAGWEVYQSGGGKFHMVEVTQIIHRILVSVMRNR